MQGRELPDYEVPELLVYGSFRDLTRLDWSLGIYPSPKIGGKKKKKLQKSNFGGCQVSGLCGSSSSSS